VRSRDSRLLSTLITVVLVAGLAVTWPSPAEAAPAVIDIGTLSAGNLHNSDSGAESQWEYHESSHVLYLTSREGEYTLTGSNSALSIQPYASGINVTLDGATITAPSPDRDALVLFDNSTLTLVGSSTLTGQQTSGLMLYGESNATITSSAGGSLKVSGSENPEQASTLRTINAGLLVNANSRLQIRGNAQVTADGSNGVVMYSGSSIEVSADATLNIQGEKNGIVGLGFGVDATSEPFELTSNNPGLGEGSITLTSQGTVKVTGNAGCGIQAAGSFNISGTGTLTVEGSECGISVDSLTVKDCQVSLKGNAGVAIQTSSQIMQNDQAVVIMTNLSGQTEEHVFASSNQASDLPWVMTGKASTSSPLTDLSVTVTIVSGQSGTVSRGSAPRGASPLSSLAFWLILLVLVAAGLLVFVLTRRQRKPRTATSARIPAGKAVASAPDGQTAAKTPAGQAAVNAPSGQAAVNALSGQAVEPPAEPLAAPPAVPPTEPPRNGRRFKTEEPSTSRPERRVSKRSSRLATSEHRGRRFKT